MKPYYPITLCLLLVGIACTSVQEESSNTERLKIESEDVFYATLEQSGAAGATKVYADENLKVLWNANDRISIFNRYTYGYEYAFQGLTGDTAGAFVKEEDEAEFVTGNPLDKIYTVYPYRADNKINNSGELSILWPSTQTYKPESFGIGSNVMVSVTTNNQLRFRNVGGYLALKLYGDNVTVTSITLRGNNGEKLSGKATVSASTDEDPTLYFDVSAQGSLRLNCAQPVTIGTTAEDATVFWFVVPPSQFTQGFNITVCTSEGGVFVKSTDSSYDIERNTLCRMAAVEVIPADIIPFEDANFKAYCVENFDTDGDGEISYLEAELIDTMSVNANNIYSMKGIEYMPNLAFLRCSGTTINKVAQGHLTDLDVSHNTALTFLVCGNNQLTSLDVSKNTALTFLSCGNNQLTSLDISKNTELNLLYCGRNELTSLDVSKCSVLTELYCYNNQLTNLDVKDNHSLDILECYGNPMTSLDLSGCSSLTSLDCAPGNAYAPGSLVSLNLSGCTALQELYCYNNQLTSLDVSTNSALTYLRCDSNPYLTDIWLKAGQTIATFLYDSSIAQIHYLGLNDIISFEDANFKAYCVNAFDTNDDGELSVGEALNVTSISVCTDDIVSLQGVEFFKNLTSLSCTGTYNSDSGTWNGRLTSLDVSNNKALTSLTCEYNQLTSIDVSSNTALTILWCYNNELTALDVSNNTALTNLLCSHNQLSSLDVSGNTALTNLWCDNNELTALDVSNNTALTQLDCSDNQLTALYVTNNLSLVYLGCNDNQLSALDVSNHTALTSMSCGWNQLTVLDVSDNTALTRLDCNGNQLTSIDVSSNTAITELYCSNNQLTSLVVNNNTELNLLWCDYNDLTALDVSHNIALTQISCNGNQMTSLDVSNNSALTNLRCEYNVYLTEIWLKTGQTIETFEYDSTVAQIHYKD